MILARDFYQAYDIARVPAVSLFVGWLPIYVCKVWRRRVILVSRILLGHLELYRSTVVVQIPIYG